MTDYNKKRLQQSSDLITSIWSIKDSQIPDHKERYIEKQSLK